MNNRERTELGYALTKLNDMEELLDILMDTLDKEGSLTLKVRGLVYQLKNDLINAQMHVRKF